MNKTENEAAGDRGSCESCHANFPYRLIHSGFNDSPFAYCDLCGMLALLSHSEAPRDLKTNKYGPVTDDMEGRLAPCRCGGKFRASASPRCPDCSKELSAERAAEWIERNAPGTAKGWRWQRSWQGTYALLIDGKLVRDNWQESNSLTLGELETMMTLDFFPLKKGATREYATESAAGSGRFKIEVLDVSIAGETTTAKCRRTVKRGNGTEEVGAFTVVKDAEGVRSDEDIEYKHPVKVGTEWISAPRRCWIEALDAAIETPAGKFAGCLRVAYLIAEGDGGSGERHYAPGVGLVKVVENDEANPFTHELIARSG